MKAYVLKSDGRKEEARPRPRPGDPNPRVFSVEEMQDMVGGYASVTPLVEGVVMVYDADGMYKERVFNPAAVELLRKCGNEKPGLVAGPVLICGSDMVGD